MNEMVLLWVRRPESNFGAFTDDSLTSKKAKLASRKYMGVWSWWSVITVVMMVKFPSHVFT